LPRSFILSYYQEYRYIPLYQQTIFSGVYPPAVERSTDSFETACIFNHAIETSVASTALFPC